MREANAIRSFPRVCLTAICAAAFLAQPTRAGGLPEGPCAGTVKAIGPTVSHTMGEAPDGRPAWLAIVRAEGREYLVRCDPETGLVNDVSPRRRADRETQQP